jgi:hypothetical protein
LFYPASQKGEPKSVLLVGYVDAAFADCKVGRKSTGGFLFCINSAPITWQSKRQSVVTTSSTEAEYVAACEATKEAIWLRQLLEDMGFAQESATVLYEDNHSTIAQTENPLHHKRTKHIDVSYHFTREMVKEKVVVLKWISTDDQPADMLTKPLPKSVFKKFYKMLGMRATTTVVSQNVE